MTQPPAAGEDYRYLLTRDPLADHLAFMAEYPVGAATRDRRRVAEVWMAAQRRMAELRESEPGRADGADPRPLAAELRPLVGRVEADPAFRQAFADATYEVVTIDLGQVVASQKLVSLRHVRSLQARLGPDPTPEAVFRFCLPFDRVAPAHHMGRTGDEEFVFRSLSNDLRFLEAVLLRPDQIVGYQPAGLVAGVVALVVGYGANYLHALSMGGRLVLNNGHHRACALYDLGVRRVPCVVQSIAHPDEVAVHAPRAVRRNLDFYVSEPRPPVVADYFDPVLSDTVRLDLSTKQVRVSYSVEEKDVP